MCLPVYVAGPKELEVAEEVLPVAGGVHPTPGKENDQMILSPSINRTISTTKNVLIQT